MKPRIKLKLQLRHLSQSIENKIAFHQLYKRHGTPEELLKFYIETKPLDFVDETFVERGAD